MLIDLRDNIVWIYVEMEFKSFGAIFIEIHRWVT